VTKTINARLFNNYFYSVFNANVLSTQLDNSRATNNDTLLSDVVITNADVHETLSSLDPNKAIGLDGVSPKVLKYCADVHVLCQPIRYLFQLINYALQSPTIRLAYTVTHCVISIFKSGDQTVID